MDRKLQTHELNRLAPSEVQRIEKHPIHVILDNVRSHHNVGSIFRTCDAFLIEKIWLCGITPCPPHRDIHKTALGAELTVSWEQRISPLELIQDLRKQGFAIVAVEQTESSVKVNTLESTKRPIALIFGNEVNGVTEDLVQLSDECWEIPQSGSKHSLNVSVCAGVVLWEVYKAFI